MCVHTHAYTHTNTNIHSYTHALTTHHNTHTHTHTHTHTRAHTNTYTYHILPAAAASLVTSPPAREGCGADTDTVRRAAPTKTLRLSHVDLDTDLDTRGPAAAGGSAHVLRSCPSMRITRNAVALPLGAGPRAHGPCMYALQAGGPTRRPKASHTKGQAAARTASRRCTENPMVAPDASAPQMPGAEQVRAGSVVLGFGVRKAEDKNRKRKKRVRTRRRHEMRERARVRVGAETGELIG